MKLYSLHCVLLSVVHSCGQATHNTYKEDAQILQYAVQVYIQLLLLKHIEARWGSRISSGRVKQ